MLGMGLLAVNAAQVLSTLTWAHVIHEKELGTFLPPSFNHPVYFEPGAVHRHAVITWMRRENMQLRCQTNFTASRNSGLK